MKAVKKLTGLKWVLALAVVLAMTGTGWAKKNGGGPGIPGDLNSNRDSVTLSLTVDPIATCDDAVTTQSYAVKAYLFQPSGRLLAIGMGTSDTFTCSVTDITIVDVTVDAVPGLNFKPGPATLLYQVILTDTSSGTPIVTVVPNTEKGSRIDLH